MQKKFIYLVAGIFMALPSVILAANSTAQDFDDLGMALYQKGLYDKAINYFQKAVQADPTDWQGYENLGDAYSKSGDNQDALNAYQQSLRIHPDNPEVQAHIDSLGGSSNSVSPANPPSATQPSVAPPPNNQVDQEPPAQGNGYFVPRRRYRPKPVSYNDGLAPMDHAKVWTSLELGYNYSTQGDLVNSANVVNNEISNGTLPVYETGNTPTGNALSSNDGFNFGGEVGFLLNPNNGIAIGLRYIQTNDNTININYNDSYGDTEDTTLTPYVVPLTLDYYLFLPDGGGRFFLSAGIGYYFGVVHVEQNVTYTDTNIPETYNSAPSGDLTAGGVGFQVGIGREFAVGRNMGVEIFARGRYAKLTNFRGTLVDLNTGYSGTYGLAKFSDGSVDIWPAGEISGSTTNATVDYTGFDVGFALNFYSF